MNIDGKKQYCVLHSPTKGFLIFFQKISNLSEKYVRKDEHSLRLKCNFMKLIILNKHVKYEKTKKLLFQLKPL